MIGPRGCLSFFTTLLDLKKFSKANGIQAAENHLLECTACNRRFEVRQKPLFKTICERALPLKSES